jgi:hypothetical protein
MKTLKNKVAIQPLWTSYIQCLKAVSDYLELGHSTAWIFGASGHGFIMNLHPELCPSGPTAFSHLPLETLARNLGFTLYGMDFAKTDQDFKDKQLQAFLMVKMALDNEMPTFGWELMQPEYYYIYEIDKDNYLFYGLNGREQKLKHDLLGTGDIGMVSIRSANPEGKKADIIKTLKDSFAFALEFSKGNKDWVFPGYHSGLKAYTVWIDALQEGKANHFGLGYNSQVWAEGKAHACEFLREAKAGLKTKVLDNLIEHYDVISWSMQKVAALFPMGGADFDAEKTDTAADALFLAKEAEKSALAEMKLLLSQL